ALGASSYPERLLASGGSVAFGRFFDSSLHISDGTFAGTTSVNLQPEAFADWNGNIVLSDGNSIWIRQPDGGLSRMTYGRAAYFTPVGDSLFFARNGKAFASDGTFGAEVELASFPYASCQGELCPFHPVHSPFGFVDTGTIVMIVVRRISEADQDELWKTDGTVAGTSKVADVTLVSGQFEFDSAVLGGKLLFTASDPAHGLELWISDGTGAGTSRLADIEPGTGGSSPAGFVKVGDRVFFSATTASNGRER